MECFNTIINNFWWFKYYHFFFFISLIIMFIFFILYYFIIKYFVILLKKYIFFSKITYIYLIILQFIIFYIIPIILIFFYAGGGSCIYENHEIINFEKSLFQIHNSFYKNGENTELLDIIGGCSKYYAFSSFKQMMDWKDSRLVSIEIIGHSYYWSYKYTFVLDADSPESWNPYIIKKNSKQWVFFFEAHPNIAEKKRWNEFQTRSTNPLILPYKQHIKLYGTSFDTFHSWNIPDLEINLPVFYGRTTTDLLYIPKSGVYHGACKLCHERLLGVDDIFNLRGGNPKKDISMPIEIYCVSNHEYRFYLSCIISGNFYLDEYKKIVLIPPETTFTYIKFFFYKYEWKWVFESFQAFWVWFINNFYLFFKIKNK